MSILPLRRPYVTWTLLAMAWWGLHGAANAAHYRFLSVSVGNPVSWQHALSTALVSAILWVPVTVAALWLVEKFPVGRRRWAVAALVHLGAAALVVIARAAFVILANDWVGWYATLPSVTQVFLTSVINNFFLYLLLVGAAHALHYARAAREREAQLARAQIQALTSQLQPHFLFNSLNTISAMMHRDANAADRMLARLSDLLRHTLAAHDTPEVSLREELELLALYLDIETTRFADRLTVSWDVDPAALDLRVPHLLLQPLVENAVKHGIAPRSEPGVIEIWARAVGEWLQLEVRDDGVGLREEGQATRRGVGLSNVRGRLAQLYPERHHLELRERERGGVAVSLVLPALPFAPAAPPPPSGQREETTHVDTPQLSR